MNRRDFITLFGGAAAVWPLTARAQQPTMPVIGFMSARSPEDSVQLVESFRRGLKESGFVEGKNAAVEYRWARGDYDQLPALAADLVTRRVNVIAVVGGAALEAKRATSIIPIVFGMGGDPVADGLVESYNRPGGNATGITMSNIFTNAKRLGLLRDLAPGVPLIGVLLNPAFRYAGLELHQIEEAAHAVNQRLAIAKASTDAELSNAFALLIREGVGALLVAGDPFFDTRRDRITGFAEQERLPAIYQFRDYVLAGGLLSYGVSTTEAYRLVGMYTAKVLNGVKPADLPVYQAIKFELVINMKTAKELKIQISDNLLSLADEVIE